MSEAKTTVQPIDIGAISAHVSADIDVDNDPDPMIAYEAFDALLAAPVIMVNEEQGIEYDFGPTEVIHHCGHDNVYTELDPGTYRLVRTTEPIFVPQLIQLDEVAPLREDSVK